MKRIPYIPLSLKEQTLRKEASDEELLLSLLKEWGEGHGLKIEQPANDSALVLFRAGCDPIRVLGYLHSYIHHYDDLGTEFREAHQEAQRISQIARQLRKCIAKVQRLSGFTVGPLENFSSAAENAVAYLEHSLLPRIKWKPSRSMEAAPLHSAWQTVRRSTGKPFYKHLQILLESTNVLPRSQEEGNIAHIVKAFEDRKEMPMTPLTHVWQEIRSDRRQWKQLRQEPRNKTMRKKYLRAF